MAYLDTELRNAKLIWSKIADRVLVAGLIIFGIVASGQLAAFLLNSRADMLFQP